MPRHLILRLEAPLIAFGGEAVDNYGVILDFPAHSLLTGLIANALGYRRGEAEQHQRLQDRLVYAARLDRRGERIRDFQTAELAADERGWTRSGRPEGRSGGAGTYKGPHLRYRDYMADASVCVALTLDPASESPTLDDVAAALDRPARPLFLGRKPCLPTVRILEGEAEAASPRDALESHPPLPGGDDRVSIFFADPAREGERTEQVHVATRRNWPGDVHAGVETVHRVGFDASSDREKSMETDR